MKGAIITRELKDGTKRYDAVYRVNGKQRQRSFWRLKAEAAKRGTSVKWILIQAAREWLKRERARA